MELKCVGEGYSCPQFALKNGQTTKDLGMDISDKKKKQMYEDYPGLFIVIGDESVGLTVKTPEDNLAYKTKEDTTEKAKGRPKKA